MSSNNMILYMIQLVALNYCSTCTIYVDIDKIPLCQKYVSTKFVLCFVLPGVYSPPPMSIHTWGITSSCATSHSWKDWVLPLDSQSSVLPWLGLDCPRYNSPICHNHHGALLLLTTNLLRHNFPHLHLVGDPPTLPLLGRGGTLSQIGRWNGWVHFIIVDWIFLTAPNCQNDKNIFLVWKHRKKLRR